MSDVFYQLFNVLSSPCFAQNGPRRITSGVIVGYLDKIVSYIFPIAGLLSVGFIIYGGYMWMVSGGDPERVKQAQGTLTWAILGLIFTVLARVILGLIYGGLQS